jgi:2-keto-4-pentenoate hydratase
VADAYRIQDRVAALRRARGERCVGYKIGCVGPAIQQQLGINHPVRGRLWDTELHSSGATLERRRFANLAIEGEIAVRLSRDLPAGASDVGSCVEGWFPIIELHQYVFRGNRATATELIAGNAMHAGIVLPAASASRVRKRQR